jgi:hypothetical protein
MSRKLINKIAKKRFDKKCYFCDCDTYELLDLHRIIEGSEGGQYSDFNTITVCSLCHRKIHSKIIVIDRKYMSTSGRYVLHYWINGEEQWS